MLDIIATVLIVVLYQKKIAVILAKIKFNSLEINNFIVYFNQFLD